MNKIIVFLLATGAALGSFYYYKNHMAGESITDSVPFIGGGNNDVLSYVPADTVFFAGGTKAFPMQKYFDTAFQYQTNPAEISSELPEDAEPGMKFMFSLVEQYIAATNSGSLDALGAARENRSVFYTAGITPVFRLHLDKPENFKKAVAKAEQDSGVTAVKGELKGISYQAYDLSEESQFVIAYQDEFAVVTLKLGGLPEESFALALGATKPEKAILDSDLLTGTMKRYDFLPEGVFILSFENLAQYLTSANNAEREALLATLDDKQREDFAFLNDAQCQTELNQLAKNWRGFFGGYKKLDFSGNRIEANMEYHLEHNNAELGKALMNLRGFVLPKFRDLESKRVLGFGMGFDTTKVFMSLSQIWEGISKSQYQCEQLRKAHTSLMQSNPAAMATMTSMLAGMKGANIDLQEIKLIQGGPVPAVESVELGITLSADDPKQLMATATTMVPFLNGMPIPEQGQTVDVPFPVPMVNVPAKVSLFGKHIAITLGDKALASAKGLSSVEPNANGFYLANMDFGRLMELVGPSLRQYAGMLQADPKEVEDFLVAAESYEGQFAVYIDFAANSFVMGVDYIGENKAKPQAAR